MRKIAVAAATAASLTLTACEGGSSTQAVQGQVFGGTPAAATVFSALGGGSGICSGAVEGTQVVVKGPSGTLLATTTLQKDTKAAKPGSLRKSATALAAYVLTRRSDTSRCGAPATPRSQPTCCAGMKWPRSS